MIRQIQQVAAQTEDQADQYEFAQPVPVPTAASSPLEGIGGSEQRGVDRIIPDVEEGQAAKDHRP